VIFASLAICLATWFVTERTRLGSYLRAATENAVLVRAFGINVPRMITITYGFGVGLAALAGVMAAPIYTVNPQMGANLIIVVFAVVVIGGMGSILGAIVTGFGLGVVEGLTKVFYPEASNTVIFVIMVIVLLIKPAGLFGRTPHHGHRPPLRLEEPEDDLEERRLAAAVGTDDPQELVRLDRQRDVLQHRLRLAVGRIPEGHLADFDHRLGVRHRYDSASSRDVFKSPFGRSAGRSSTVSVRPPMASAMALADRPDDCGCTKITRIFSARAFSWRSVNSRSLGSFPSVSMAICRRP
jgi:hypothetical protein